MAHCLQTEEIVPGYHSNLSVHVCVENVDKNISEEDVWSQMEIESDGNVIHKRLTRDPTCDHALRAIIIYNDNYYVSKMAKEINGKKVGEHIVRADIASNKVALLQSSATKVARDEFTGEVFVSGFNPKFEEKHLDCMFKTFGVKSVTVIRNGNAVSIGAAVVKLSDWNSAMQAEMAFDGIAMEGGSTLYVIARRNRQQKVCIPWKLVEVMAENASPVKKTVTEQQSSTAATSEKGTDDLELRDQKETGKIDIKGEEVTLSEIDCTKRDTREIESDLTAENGGQKKNTELSVCEVKEQESRGIKSNVVDSDGEKAGVSESNEDQTCCDTANGSQGAAAEPTAAERLEQIGQNMKILSSKKHRYGVLGVGGNEDAEILEDRNLEQSPQDSSTESTDRATGLRLQFHMEMDERDICRCRDVCKCTCNCEVACRCPCRCKDYCRCRNTS